jgi:DNA-binding FadR family transcriptional regulator
MTRFAPLAEAIHKHTAKEIISDKIISLIASGILQVGDELPGERELAAMLSVSRETVRGAVQRLAGQGILQVSQGARTRIARGGLDVESHRIGVTTPSSINGYSLDAVHEARLLVETSVVADAAVRIAAEDLARLEASLVAQAAAADDPVRFLICDREFHLTIYGAASNRLLADFVVDLYTYMLDQRRRAMSRPGAIARSLEDHREIVAALKERSAEAVAAAFGRHIRRIHDTSRAVESSTGEGDAGRKEAGAQERTGVRGEIA